MLFNSNSEVVSENTSIGINIKEAKNYTITAVSRENKVEAIMANYDEPIRMQY